MLHLIKIEDWFKDGTTIVRTLRKGKGRNPYTDSTVSFRIQISVDGKVLVNNYPDSEPKEFGELTSSESGPYDFSSSENLKLLTGD